MKRETKSNLCGFCRYMRLDQTKGYCRKFDQPLSIISVDLSSKGKGYENILETCTMCSDCEKQERTKSK